MLVNSKVTAIFLLVQISLNGAKSVKSGYGDHCMDFTLDDCPLVDNTIIDQHAFQIPQCVQWCSIINGCLLWLHDGRMCYLLETDNRDTCHISGAPVDGDIQDCIANGSGDFLNTCDGYIEMACTYTGQHVAGSPSQPGAITDEETCKINCFLFECRYWVFDEEARVCNMYHSDSRECIGLSGPNPNNAPSMLECGIPGTPTTTASPPPTTTTSPPPTTTTSPPTTTTSPPPTITTSPPPPPTTTSPPPTTTTSPPPTTTMSPPTTTKASECGEGWAIFGNSCYKILNNQNSQYGNIETCRKECTGLGGTLGSIHSSEENEFIFNLLRPARTGFNEQDTWLGGNMDDGTLRWEDGTPLDYSNWRPSEPDGDGCVFMGSHPSYPDKWADGVCSFSSVFDCLCKQTIVQQFD